MTYSLGEIEALCLKAARGAGFPWGLAEDAGRAVRWLEARGQNGAAALAGLLSATDGMPRDDNCPIAYGSALADMPPVAPISRPALLNPILLEPFLAGTATIRTDGLTLWITPSDLPVPKATQSRAALDQSLYMKLDKFAQRTYAPATEASRLAGAGTGGLTDND